MAIYQVRKARFTGTFTSILMTSLVVLTASCSRLGTPIGATGSANAEAAAGAPAQPHASQSTGQSAGTQTVDTATAAPNTGVRTNHDVFHSRTIEVPAGTEVPAVSVRVEEDAVQGWNLYVGTANFTFEPSKVNGESSATAGHANLYINDEPIQRIYGTWTHLPTLPGGENEIRVTLNANGHETLTTQGTPIEDSVTVEVYDPNQTD